MKLPPLLSLFRSKRGSVRLRLVFALAVTALVPLGLWSGAPAWWMERGVINSNATADDYTAVNQGQVKHIAKQAYDEMEAKLPGGAGQTLDAIWETPAASTDDYRAINIGQLKHVAEPFYARLEALNYTGQPLVTGQTRPWGTGTDDFALANIGQAKNLFSFKIISPYSDPFDLIVTSVSDIGANLAWNVGANVSTIVQASTDHGATWKTITVLSAGIDQYSVTNFPSVATAQFQVVKSANGVIAASLVDWMQNNNINPSSASLSADEDNDGLTTAEEAQRGTNPKLDDTDGDGVKDPDDGWPRHAWIKIPPLPEVNYAVVRLHALNFPLNLKNNYRNRLDDDCNVLMIPDGWTPSPKLWLAASSEVLNVPLKLTCSPYLSIYHYYYLHYNRDYIAFSRKGGYVAGFIDQDGAHAAVWDKTSGTPRILDSDYYTCSVATVVNSSGTVAGWKETADMNAIYDGGVIWGEGDWLEGGPLQLNSYTNISGDAFIPSAINDAGIIGGELTLGSPASELIYGISDRPDSLNKRAMINDNGALFDLGEGSVTWISNTSPPFGIINGNSSPLFIYKENEAWNSDPAQAWDPLQHISRQIYPRRGNDRMEFIDGDFITRNDQTNDLNKFISPNWSLMSTRDINNHGVILANAKRTLDDAGQPIPNPQTEPILLVPGALRVDLNRDGKINDKDAAVSVASPFRFWLNDDDDSGDTNGSDIPIVATTNNGPANWQGDGGTYFGTHGARDLIDWFPVYLDIKQLITVSPPGTNITYKLKQEESALNFVYTGLTRDTATAYQKENKGLIFGPNLTQKVGLAEKRWMTAAGVDIFGGSTGSAEFLDAIKHQSGGVILIEGRKATTKPLILSVEKSDGTVISEVKLEIKISSVEDMYRRLNFRDGPDAPAGLLGDTSERDEDLGLPTYMGEADGSGPKGYPDSLTNGKWFVMVIGSNVGGQKMRGWQSEVFKRMWWSKSKARFVGVSWYGDPYSDGNDLVYDYHSAARNAFATAPALATALNGLSGSKTVAGHSAAALIISSAVADHGLNASNTCLLDAAMARECFDGSKADDIVGMVPKVWRDPTYPPALWAARWSERFSTTDARSGLTWRNRFTNAITRSKVHNFYSSTEEVLGRYEGTVNGSIIENIRAPGSFAWVIQEKAKGDKLRIGWFIHAGSDYGGWGFNLNDPLTSNLPKWYVPDVGRQRRDMKTPAQIGTPPTSLLDYSRYQPLFKTGWGRYDGANPAQELIDTNPAMNTGPSWILDLYGVTSGNTIAADPLKRTQLLNEAIPATSLAVGANPLAFSTLPNTQQYDMPAQFADPAHWPSARGANAGVPNWHHSDMREVAYIYLYQFYDKLGSLSNQ